MTFYLTGQPERLQKISRDLSARGWLNVHGSEGAFLYPKVQVEKSVEGVVRAAETAQDLCFPHDIEILSIDADTSCDVERSQFVTLYLGRMIGFPAPDGL